MKFDYKRLVKFEHNVSEQEKKIRLGVGAAMILVSLFLANILLLLVGLVLITTGYIGWCPAYSGFDKNTCGVNESNDSNDENNEETLTKE